MKDQYFGDINDYLKYGLLRLLAGDRGCDNKQKIGVCWMLTENDDGPDGEMTKYLHSKNEDTFKPFDPCLYEFLKEKVHGHEDEKTSRCVSHFDDKQLLNGHFFNEKIKDSADDRNAYFESMWEDFQKNEVELLFFDPDDGLANNNKEIKSPLKKGLKNSSKKLFRDEVICTLKKRISVLLYQHFPRVDRKTYVNNLGKELAGMSDSNIAYSFWTPRVVFFLIPHPDHATALIESVQRVKSSRWAEERSAPTSNSNGNRQILVTEHKYSR